MTDNELDTMLREHGATWREDHSQRPGIDWAAVTEAKPYPKVLHPKVWLGVIAVAATAAAVIVPLAVVGGTKPPAKPNPANHKPLPLKIAETGAPAGFFAIAPPTVSGKGGAFAFVQGTGSASIRPGNAVASGVGSDPNRGYEAFRAGPCTSKFYDLTYKAHYHHDAQGFVDNGTVATVHAQVARSAMAVSPDGKQIAFAENRTINPTTGQCVGGPQRIGILNLATKTTVAFNTRSKDYVESLVWAPDNRHLGFELVPGPQQSDLKTGVHIIDTHALGSAVLPADPGIDNLPEQPGGDGVIAPLIYWHGQLAMLFAGKLRLVGADGKPGAPLIGGLPRSALSISADPTGQHLLIVAGPFMSTALGSRGFVSSGYSNEQELTVGTTYRWDNGRLSTVKDTWIDPAW